MAALFCCSGDHIDTATSGQKWSTAPTIVPSGKHGRGHVGAGSKSPATIRSARAVMGMWFRSTGGTLFTMIAAQGSLGGGIGALALDGGGGLHYTIINPSLTSHFSVADLWHPGIWHFIELDILVDPGTAGHIKVYLDDPLHASPVIDETSINTIYPIYAAGYHWGGVSAGNSNTTWDDFYLLDGASTDVYGNTGAPTEPLGPIRIDVVRPEGVGFKEEWVPDPVVPNWQNVDDDAPDGTTVNTAAGSGSPTGVGDEDLHEMQDISTGDTAIFQHLMVSATKDGEGLGQLTMIARHDGTTYDLETRNLAEDYFYRTRVALHTMPNGDPLSDANFNAQEFGYRREA